MTKIWRKPLHKRKLWKSMSLYGKTVYYLQPFLIHLITTWQQPLPFPTIFKMWYSCFLIALVLLPIILPIVIIISYYAAIQYILESALDIVYPKNFDVLHYLNALFTSDIENEKYIEVIGFHIQRWCYVTASTASCVDYMRLISALATG